MAKNVKPERKAAIERVARAIGERSLDEQGVSDAAYTCGLHAIAVDLAESNTELLEALKDLLASISGEKKSCGHEFTCICPEDKARAAIAKATGGAA